MLSSISSAKRNATMTKKNTEPKTPDLDSEFQYYIDNQERFVRDFNERVIVLKGTEVLADFADMGDGYWFAKDQGLLGSVFIHKVGAGRSNYTTTLHSRPVLD